MIQFYMMILLLGILGGAGFGAYSYYNDTQERIQQLSENNAKLESAVETQTATINTLKESAEQQAKLNRELQGKLQQAESYQDKLRANLAKNDLTKRTLENPADMEVRINNGTKRLLEEFESDTAK